MKAILTFIILSFGIYVCFCNCYGQEKKASPWINVENFNKLNLKIDISSLKLINDSDIYVWVLESYKDPIQIEGIENKIYKTKTYYLLNKSKMKYSILEIVYYDSANKILKDFVYGKKTDLASYKYNYPIISNTPIEAILEKSIKQLAKINEKIQ